jgi:hypothetical protein
MYEFAQNTGKAPHENDEVQQEMITVLLKQSDLAFFRPFVYRFLVGEHIRVVTICFGSVH